jgi:nucleoside-diphosphate-sugar epimerase
VFAHTDTSTVPCLPAFAFIVSFSFMEGQEVCAWQKEWAKTLHQNDSFLLVPFLVLGHYVVGVDWKENEHFKAEEFCDEFKLLDLRDLSNCEKAVEGCDWVFNLAADMGGMGFIQSNNSSIMYNNTMISINILEAGNAMYSG